MLSAVVRAGRLNASCLAAQATLSSSETAATATTACLLSSSCLSSRSLLSPSSISPQSLSASPLQSRSSAAWVPSRCSSEAASSKWKLPPQDVPKLADLPFDPEEVEAEAQASLLQWGPTKNVFFWNIDPRCTFIKSVIDPMFTLHLPNGSERICRFECQGYGPQVEVSLRLQGVWLRKAPVEKIARREPIPVIGGFDVMALGTHFTYLRLNEEGGRVFMWGLNFGVGFGASVLSGGYIMPCSRGNPFDPPEVEVKPAQQAEEKQVAEEKKDEEEKKDGEKKDEEKKA